MQRATLFLLLLAGATGGCTCGKSEEKKKEQPAATTDDRQAGKELDPEAARKRAEAMRKMKMAPITVDEVKALIPTLPNTTPVGLPGVMTEGRQVKAVLCMVSPSADTAMTQMVGALGTLGFTNVQTRPHPHNQEMVTLHAEKQLYQLGATAQKSTTPDCPADRGKIKFVLSYFKRVTAVPMPAP
jgi:hypothetical protein